MDIKAMDRIAYNYTFEINDIKRAVYQNIICFNKLATINEVSKADINRIKMYSKDFRKCCYKLIKADNISDITDYLKYINSIILINAHIQKILKNKKYKKVKAIRKLENEYNKINQRIDAESALEIIVNNHVTATLLLIAFIILISTPCVLFICKNTAAGIIAYIASTLIILCLYIFYFPIINRRLEIDKINRTINRHTILKSKKIKELRKNILSLFNKIK